MKSIDESAQLTCQIEGEDLVIRIGIPLLVHALENGPELDGWRITDPMKFTEEIVKELEADGEDGTTLLHQAFDTAANRAIENGSDYAIELLEDDEDPDAE